MKLIFSYSFTQENDLTGLRRLHPTCQEKMMANVQEITGLLSHLYSKDHPYVILPIITGSAPGAMHNTFFVCCRGCKEILARALPYGRAHFRVICP